VSVLAGLINVYLAKLNGEFCNLPKIYGIAVE